MGAIWGNVAKNFVKEKVPKDDDDSSNIDTDTDEEEQEEAKVEDGKEVIDDADKKYGGTGKIGGYKDNPKNKNNVNNRLDAPQSFTK